MYSLGKVIEYHPDKGFGYLSNHHNDHLVQFYIDDFPKEGGAPQKGENIKYMIVETQNVIKANKIIRLDIAVNESLKNKKANIMKQKKILKKSENDSYQFSFTSIVIIVIFSGLIYFAIAAWNQYKNYQEEQYIKFTLLEQQQKEAIQRQRQEVGHVKPVIFSEKSKNALNEETKFNHLRTQVKNSEVKDMQVIRNIPESKNNSTPDKEVSTQFKCDGRTHCSQMNSYEEALFFIRNCPNTKMDGNRDGFPCEKQFNRR